MHIAAGCWYTADPTFKKLELAMLPYFSLFLFELNFILFYIFNMMLINIDLDLWY
jgi:hypothetical protein